MTGSNATRGPDDRTEGAASSERNLVNIIYILYLASLIFGVTAVIGVIMAYVNYRDAPRWLWTRSKRCTPKRRVAPTTSTEAESGSA